MMHRLIHSRINIAGLHGEEMLFIALIIFHLHFPSLHFSSPFFLTSKIYENSQKKTFASSISEKMKNVPSLKEF